VAVGVTVGVPVGAPVGVLVGGGGNAPTGAVCHDNTKNTKVKNSIAIAFMTRFIFFTSFQKVIDLRVFGEEQSKNRILLVLFSKKHFYKNSFFKTGIKEIKGKGKSPMQ